MLNAALSASCPPHRSSVSVALPRRAHHSPHSGCRWLQEAPGREEGERQQQHGDLSGTRGVEETTCLHLDFLFFYDYYFFMYDV